MNRSIVWVAASATAVLLAPAVPAAASAPTSAPADTLTIAEIHGDTFVSPYDGLPVTGVTGVVTAVAGQGRSRGFYMQDGRHRAGDGSHGLFVFTGSSTPGVTLGDEVVVSGTVDDYYPDAPPSRSVDLPNVELTGASWTVLSHGNPLPAPLLLGPGTVPTRLTARPGGDIEHRTLRPQRYALDFFAAHAGELVEVHNARVVGPTNSYGELFVTDKPWQNRDPRGGTVYRGYHRANTGRIELAALPGAPDAPVADVGDMLLGVTAGPLTYSEFGGYEIEATRFGTLVPGGITRESTRPQAPGELAVATYNVENLSPVDDPAKFARLARGIVDHLASPDIVSLEEIQDNSGPADNGVVAADRTLAEFTDAIVAAGGPRYAWREIDPVNDADGGQPGGNIRNAFLFNPQRVSFVDIPGGGSTVPVTVTGPAGHPSLSASPGRIAPADEAWQDSRKPLVGQFRFHGSTVFVIGNHFDSKGGDQPLEGRYQPPERSSEVQRQQQAALVHDFVAQLEQRDADVQVVVLGDLNDYQFSPALAALTAGRVLRDLIDRLPWWQQYSYVYQGNSQVLDHILTSPAVVRPDYDVVHINAEFADQASDHDPQIVRFRP